MHTLVYHGTAVYSCMRHHQSITNHGANAAIVDIIRLYGLTFRFSSIGYLLRMD